MTCFHCKKRILSERRAVVLSYMVGDSRKQVYLCRQQREGEPGCAEDLFGEELPGLLNERPSQPDRVVVDFRRRSKHWERL